MRTVNIAELKKGLSAYLQEVRAGEEFIVRDRNLPVARLIPLAPVDVSSEEMELVAAGKLRLPSGTFDEESFWRGEPGKPLSPKKARAVRRAVSDDREESDDRLLGR